MAALPAGYSPCVTGRPPGSTYRVQLHAGFTFADLADAAGYLADLGVTHLYCSPSLEAVPGSTHGYDVVDPHRMNPELGGVDGFAELADRLGAAGLGIVLDIVPNHMALGPGNRWWWDVLANGPSSRFAPYFDIDWDSPERKLTGTVLVPILGDHYGRVLEAGALQVERAGGAFVVRYADHVLPLSPRSVGGLLVQASERITSPELHQLGSQLAELPHALIVDPDLAGERHRRSRLLEAALLGLVEERAEVGGAIDDELKELNEDYDRLDDLLNRQNYRLAFWRTAGDELDYRRFFNIDTLVGLRVEDPQVFDDTHSLVLALVEGRIVDGLRADHIDGLRDPSVYLDRLARATGDAWVVVEKILAPDEELPESWPVAGTTGYDFLSRVNDLFVAIANLGALDQVYRQFVGDEVGTDFLQVAHRSKLHILREELAAEVERLTAQLSEVCERHRRQRDYTRRELRGALREVLASFTVYRTYVRPGEPLRDGDRRAIDDAVAAASAWRPDLDAELFGFLGALLRLEFAGPREEEFVARFQQLTPPVMAKGVEDTAFYRYHRLISCNEVGGSPDVSDGAIERFHRWCSRAARSWPATMGTLATHDTKRGPDARARINVLSEMPGAWGEAVARWAAHNDRHRPAGPAPGPTGPGPASGPASDHAGPADPGPASDHAGPAGHAGPGPASGPASDHADHAGPAGHAGPDRNDEYLLYQTLVGSWPIEPDRVVAYLRKATKEAKVHTSWITPNPAYDDAVGDFTTGVLADEEFVADLEAFLTDHRAVEAGWVNSLAQTALLLTAPGSSDLYQGSELWDYSLVDPDNRRPVDYHLRRRLLAEVANRAEPPPLDQSGGAKLWLIHRLLGDRRRRPDAYGPASGYEPLAATGPASAHVLAFWRTGGVVTVVPRIARAVDWGPTALPLPPGSWVDILSGAAWSGTAAVGDLLAGFPVAVLAPTADLPVADPARASTAAPVADLPVADLPVTDLAPASTPAPAPAV